MSLRREPARIYSSKQPQVYRDVVDERLDMLREAEQRLTKLKDENDQAFIQKWNEIRFEQEKLALQQEHLKVKMDLFKNERKNWKRSMKIKSTVSSSFDDHSINSMGTPPTPPNEYEEMVQELREQLDETKQAAQSESQSLKQQLTVAQQSLEMLQQEHDTIEKKAVNQEKEKEQKQLQQQQELQELRNEVEKLTIACAQATEEIIQKEKDWKEQQQAQEKLYQSQLENSRELIWNLELENAKLQKEILEIRDTPNDSDYWKAEAERLQTKLTETNQELKDLQELLPHHKEILEKATVQQKELVAKCAKFERMAEEQRLLVTELQAFKENLTRRYHALEKAHQELLDENVAAQNEKSESDLPSIVLPFDDPGAWIRQGRKHVVEWTWHKNKTLCGIYTGWLDVSGAPHGHGTLRIPDGSIYDGEWNRGVRDGHGVYSSVDGHLYRGTWRNDRHHGRGVYVWSDGHIFTGDYVDGLRHGHGIETWVDGARYEGEYANDLRHGEGAYWYPNGTNISGEYHNGIFQDEYRDGDFDAFVNS